MASPTPKTNNVNATPPAHQEQPAAAISRLAAQSTYSLDYVQKLETTLATANRENGSTQRLLSRYIAVNLSLSEENISLKSQNAELKALVEQLQRPSA